MKSNIKTLILIVGIEVILGVVVVMLSVDVFKKNKHIDKLNEVIVNIETSYEEPDTVITKYDFIDSNISVYIEQLCFEMDIDPDLVFALLIQENPEFSIEAVNKNVNGTIDIGLFQLNDKYFWTTFKDSYWIEGVELDPFNWKHNAYIAIHHIKYLQNKLKLQDDVIMAYNCGIGAVMNDNIPATTYVYLAKVKNNIWLLKNCKE